MNPNNLSQSQFTPEGRLFDPGPAVAPGVDHAKEAMEFATRPDIVWHANDDPLMRPQEGRQFHAGTSISAEVRGGSRHSYSRVVFHPVSITGDFQLPSHPAESGLGRGGEIFNADKSGSPTRWSDSVINNYRPMLPESNHWGDRVTSNVRKAAAMHLADGKVLAYTNDHEDVGSTSLVTTDPNNVHMYHRGGQLLTGKLVGIHNLVDLGTVEHAPLPFDEADKQRLNIQSVFHNNVPGIHRQVAAQASRYFDTPIGLHPSSPLAQIPAVETASERQVREYNAIANRPAPDIFLGLNRLSPNSSDEEKAAVRDRNVGGY